MKSYAQDAHRNRPGPLEAAIIERQSSLKKDLKSIDFASGEAMLRPDAAGARGVLRPSELEAARRFNTKNAELARPGVLERVGAALGVERLRSWTDEALQALAGWQKGMGLTVDAKFGPLTTAKVFPGGIPTAAELRPPEPALLGPRALTAAEAFWRARGAILTPTLIGRIGAAVGVGAATAPSAALLQAVARWQKSGGLGVDGKFGRQSADAMFAGEDVLAPKAEDKAEEPQKDEVPEKAEPAPVVAPAALSAKALSSARAFYANKRTTFTPALVARIGAAVSVASAVTMDDALIQALAAWQAGRGLDADGKFGRGSAKAMFPDEDVLAAAKKDSGTKTSGSKVIGTDGGDREQKALAIIAALEAGGRYGALNLWDKGIVSLGIRQVTLVSGNLKPVLDSYLDKAKASGGGALLPHQRLIESFRDQTGAIQSAIAGKGLGGQVMGQGRSAHVAARVGIIDSIVGAGWVNAFKIAGQESTMQEAQHGEMKAELLDKYGGRKNAEEAGLDSTVGLAMAAHSINGGVGFDRAIRGSGLDGLKSKLMGAKSLGEVVQMTAACASALNGTKVGRNKLGRAAAHLDVLNNQWMLGTGGWGSRQNQANALTMGGDAAAQAKAAEAISIATWATMMFGFFYIHNGIQNHEFKTYLKLAATDMDLKGDGKKAIVHGVGIETGR